MSKRHTSGWRRAMSWKTQLKASICHSPPRRAGAAS
jgi:hypothetical protein